MGQYFHIKYVVQYGLSTALAAFEGVAVPRLPRCIGRVHLYSDMWKYFDPGLYNFLKMYGLTIIEKKNLIYFLKVYIHSKPKNRLKQIRSFIFVLWLCVLVARY